VELRARIDALIASQGGALPSREGGDHATKTPLATEPIRGGSQDAGYSGVGEKHSAPSDRGPAGRGPPRRRQHRDGHANHRDEGGRSGARSPLSTSPVRPSSTSVSRRLIRSSTTWKVSAGSTICRSARDSWAGTMLPSSMTI